MNFTRASFHFAAQGTQHPAATLYTHTDGYPSGAASFLRAMLVQEGIASGLAFQKANQLACQAKDPAGDAGTSFRYWLSGSGLRAEERTEKGLDCWQEVYSGPLLAFINQQTTPMLHHVGPSAQGADLVQYSTLETLEGHYAQAALDAVRYGAGVVAGGAETLEQAGYVRSQVERALRTEIGAGHLEGQPVPPKVFTVVGEFYDNEQGFTTCVEADDDDHAIDLAQAEAAAILASGRDGKDDEEPDSTPLVIWAVLRGEASAVYVKSAA